MKAKITEVFESVQGEGIYLGERQLFVRFFGCNLDCDYCDTRPNRFLEYEPQELCDEIKLYGNEFHAISFTGGEPLVQKDFLKEVLRCTAQAGYRHYLETNGTLPDALEDIIDYIDIVAMDIKLPSSSGVGELWQQHKRFLEVASKKEVFVKMIISQTSKETDLREAIALIRAVNFATTLVLQPNSCESWGSLGERLNTFRQICSDKGIVTCVIPQIHKLIGVP
ncbi:MAG: 7-carboxy-7-deazaguanine synthase QueE [Candidatus Omnitrophica bacterium]|nr:7-carboxy-7-deazaguanine synthase QueE [Candidatus Omnitrophota bacterium]